MSSRAVRPRRAPAARRLPRLWVLALAVLVALALNGGPRLAAAAPVAVQGLVQRNASGDAALDAFIKGRYVAVARRGKSQGDVEGAVNAGVAAAQLDDGRAPGGGPGGPDRKRDAPDLTRAAQGVATFKAKDSASFKVTCDPLKGHFKPFLRPLSGTAPLQPERLSEPHRAFSV